jgi:hypothetical protein
MLLLALYRVNVPAKFVTAREAGGATKDGSKWSSQNRKVSKFMRLETTHALNIEA